MSGNRRRQSPVATRSGRVSSTHSTPRQHISPRMHSGGQHQQQHRSMTPLESGRSTTGSIGSTAGFSDLEDVLQDVVGLRMSSLTDLRRKIEELGDLQKEEERSFKDAMQLVMDQTTNARELQREAEDDYESRISREKSERAKAIDIMQQFKKEGSGVMGQMKESIRTVTAKYHQELEKNAKLTAQLRKMEQQQRNGGSGGGSAGGAGAGEVNHLRTQVDALSQLLEEEDQVVVELQKRNKALESEVRHLHEGGMGSVGTGGWLSVAGADDPNLMMGGESPGEYYELLSSIKSMDRGANVTSSTGTMSVRKSQELIDKLKRFSLILMQRLKAEQRQRLKVEEQAARMAAVQDDLIQKYEARQRLGSAGSNTPTTSLALSSVDGGSASRSSVSMSPSQSSSATGGTYGGPSVGVSKSMNVGAPHLQGRVAAAPTASNNHGHRADSHRSASSASSIHSTASASGKPQPAPLPLEPQQQALVGLETIDMTTDDGGSRSSSVGQPHQQVAAPHKSDNQQHQHQHHQQRQNPIPAPSVSMTRREEPSIDPPPSDSVPSLEEQLEAVSTDFELSLQQWSDAIGGSAGTTPAGNPATPRDAGRLSAEMEHHFMPDE